MLLRLYELANFSTTRSLVRAVDIEVHDPFNLLSLTTLLSVKIRLARKVRPGTIMVIFVLFFAFRNHDVRRRDAKTQIRS